MRWLLAAWRWLDGAWRPRLVAVGLVVFFLVVWGLLVAAGRWAMGGVR